MRRTAHRGLAAGFATALLALWGCSHSPTAPFTSPVSDAPAFLRVPAGTAQPYSAGPGSGSSISSSCIDGSKGGTVSNGRFQLCIPPGAFIGTGTISISVPDPAVMQCQLSISPAGLNGFLVPVQLIADYGSSSGPGPGSPAPSDPALLWFDEVNQRWVRMPGSSVTSWNNTLTTPLPHFSSYGVIGNKAGW